MSTGSNGLSESGNNSPPQGVDEHANKHVLLLLDVQRCMMLPPPIGVPSASSVRENIEELLRLARTSPRPPLIIHVQNTGDQGDPDEEGTDGWQLLFEALPGEVVMEKKKNNAFAGTKLGKVIGKDVEVVVTGVASDFSVRATCNALVGRGNEVILVRGAHGTFDRIEVLHGGGVKAAATIELEVEGELEDAGVCVLGMSDVNEIFMDR